MTTHKTIKEAMKAAKETGKPQKVEAQPGPHSVKVNISIRLDLDVLNSLKAEGEQKGIPYQTLINSILKTRSEEKTLEARIEQLEKALNIQAG